MNRGNCTGAARPESTFERYEPQTPAQSEAHLQLQRLADGLVTHEAAILASAHPFPRARLIFLWGTPGTGKTHLVEALINRVREKAPRLLRARKLYLSRYDFTLEHVASVSTYDDAPVVVLDDLWSAHASLARLNTVDLRCFIAEPRDGREPGAVLGDTCGPGRSRADRPGLCDQGQGAAPQSGDPADALGEGRDAGSSARRQRGGRGAQSELGGGAHGLPARMDRALPDRWPAGRGEAPHPWEPPRTIAGRDPHRRARLRSLGNAISPAQAKWVGQILAREVFAVTGRSLSNRRARAAQLSRLHLEETRHD